MVRKNLTIVQLNDSHAYFDLHQELFWDAGGAVYRPAGGYARIATLLKKIQAERPAQVLFCDCGDTLHGTYPAVQAKGKSMIPVMNALAPAASTAHWEFAYTPPVFEQETEWLDYPMLAANIFEEKSGKRLFDPCTVKEVAGLRVGLVGLASNIIDKTMPPSFSTGLKFMLGKDELPAVIQLLRQEEKVDLVVLISHLGFPQDMKMMSEVEGVDVCLSAHTHNRLYRPALAGRTIVIQSGCHGSFLGRLDLEIEDGKITSYQHQLIEVRESIQPDPRVDELVRQALAPYAGELSQVVGETETGLNRYTTLESTMDNLLLDALLEHTGAQVAFSNGWRYGAPVPPGKITLNDLYDMVPMDPPVSTVDLTGKELWDMLEENLESTFSADPYRQMGGYVKRGMGLRVYFKIENPAGQRLQQVFIGDQELKHEAVYHAAFITEQGVPSKFGSRREQHSEHIVEVMRSYLSRHKPYRTALKGTYLAI